MPCLGPVLRGLSYCFSSLGNFDPSSRAHSLRGPLAPSYSTMISSRAIDCTTATCPVQNGFLSDPPSLAGSASILALFAALALAQLWIGLKCRTTTYSLVLVTGLLLDIVGYSGRLLLRSDLASKTYFLLFLLGSTLGPTFITAAIFATLPHIFALYGSDLRPASNPVWLSYVFLGFDVFTVIFQALGCGFAVEGYNRAQVTFYDFGTHVSTVWILC